MNRVKINEDVVMKIEEDAKDFMSEVGISLAESAKQLAPVDSGRLRDSIKSEDTGEKTVISTDVPYALMIEFGTAHMGAQPYLRPAIDNTKAKYD